ncbi:acetylxylan esterase [Methylococcus sp. EFPC2]|uniref:acetylxylan esterase n=1 Tax=Methylococcus sp. EFPC2 TaxID=2812648 RepID=UPI001967C135|nr:acetylxylan esterase [Methylococcus sp. EFPC2]QSA98845.1 acetylxylan esterase [Methylococcus sp. EFPC2]
MAGFPHSFPFDPSYGYTLESLLRVEAPVAPEDFADFWQARYRRALAVAPEPRLQPWPEHREGYAVYDLEYRSTDDFTLGGWLLMPQGRPVRRGLVVGHGYGGRDAPDFDLPVADAVLLFPCFRGLSRSRRPPISDQPYWHVLHDIDQRDRYILGGCVEDLWLAVSVLTGLFPAIAGHIGYMGISFGGGIGALALPWDARIRRAHLSVPTFGHHPLRLELPTVGSGCAIRDYQRRHGNVMDTLRYYDAASAATQVDVPVQVAAALFDPAVAPPGQFAIYNALAGPKSLYVLEAGHFDYPAKARQESELREVLADFFAEL